MLEKNNLIFLFFQTNISNYDNYDIVPTSIQLMLINIKIIVCKYVFIVSYTIEIVYSLRFRPEYLICVVCTCIGIKVKYWHI